MKRSNATLVALAASILFPCQDAVAAGQSELTPISVESVADRIAFLKATYEQTERGLIYRTADMDRVVIASVIYDSEGELKADLYYPPGSVALGTDGTLGPVEDGPLASGDGLPVFILPMGFQLSHWLADIPFSPRDQVVLVESMAMFASHGMVAIFYETERIDVGFERLMDFLADHESGLGLDMSRVGLYSISGHGRLAGKVISADILGDSLQCVVSVHSDIQVTTLPDRPLRFYVVHSGGSAYFDEFGIVLARRMAGLGHEVIEISQTPRKNFQYDMGSPEADTPETRAIVRGAAEFARRWLVN